MAHKLYSTGIPVYGATLLLYAILRKTGNFWGGFGWRPAIQIAGFQFCMSRNPVHPLLFSANGQQWTIFLKTGNFFAAQKTSGIAVNKIS